MEEYIMVFITAPDGDAAEQMADAAVSDGLAACCSIMPGLRSIYIWKGEMYDEKEVLCIFKTRAALFEDLKKRILDMHSYEVPEIIAVSVKDAHTDYLRWIDEVTGGKRH